MGKGSTGPDQQARCLLITGARNWPAARILDRLWYWSRYAYGRTWIEDGYVAKTYAEWAEECGLSYRQVRRGMAKLYDLKIIERRKRKWSKRQNRVQVRLDFDVLAALTKRPPAVTTSASERPPAVSTKWPPAVTTMIMANSSGETGSWETFSEAGGPAISAEKSPKKKSGQGNQREKNLPENSEKKVENLSELEKKPATPTGSKGEMKVSEIAEKFTNQEKPTEESVLAASEKAGTITELLAVWRDAQMVHATHPVVTYKAYSKAAGWVKILQSQLPEKSAIGPSLALLGSRWSHFRQFLVSRCAWRQESVPPRPSLAWAVSEALIQQTVDWLSEEFKKMSKPVQSVAPGNWKPGMLVHEKVLSSDKVGVEK